MLGGISWSRVRVVSGSLEGGRKSVFVRGGVTMETYLCAGLGRLSYCVFGGSRWMRRVRIVLGRVCAFGGIV
jgi:hypothetical protein